MAGKNQQTKISDRLGYIPTAIKINVPEEFFVHRGRIEGDREKAFRRQYEAMGKGIFEPEDDCFYHFISCCPVIEVEHVYVCFRGMVQYKAILVQYLKNQPVMLKNYQHPEPRDWVVTTGPVVRAPFEIEQKGFRGFKYTKELF